MAKRSSELRSKTQSKKEGAFSRMLSAVTGRGEIDTDAPKATDLLKDQHDQVRKLFKQYEDLSDGATSARKLVIDQVSRDLEIHAQLEEKIFYPACRALRDKKATDMVGESLEEHLIVKRLIKELAVLRGSDQRFESKATVLKESVEHHAGEEERDLFPVAESELGNERLKQLGEQMSRMKDTLDGSPKVKTTKRSPSSAKKRR